MQFNSFKARPMSASIVRKSLSHSLSNSFYARVILGTTIRSKEEHKSFDRSRTFLHAHWWAGINLFSSLFFFKNILQPCTFISFGVFYAFDLPHCFFLLFNDYSAIFTDGRISYYYFSKSENLVASWNKAKFRIFCYFCFPIWLQYGKRAAFDEQIKAKAAEEELAKAQADKVS